ncbi:MAG: hypothetical protein JNK30_06800 [Phenylobacterium sp.]|nr:hypothetical protein [Phenylobacterium sp.]
MRWAMAVLIAAIAAPAAAAELAGPARFCGYAPIIDLLPGERVVDLASGIHAGHFRWEGAFGALEVAGIGWARRPKGRIVTPVQDGRPAVVAQRRTRDGYVIAIWNGAQGVAYFTSPRPFTRAQREAIRRVTLYEEGDTPPACDLRMVGLIPD